ncbi:MAG: BTAD domain-containing putative transcriptional regulator [Chloroflexota bacterium]|nr:BTAD domain-containing putative transcriptional regulator [Chloroflexota bacterium]
MDILSLRIRLFGQFELAWGDTPLPTPRSATARSLLAYLVVHHDRAFPRDVLAGTFWPERSDAAARRALSQALWQIRQTLCLVSDRLIADRDTVTFLLQSHDWLDVADFEKSRHTYSAPVQPLEQAVALYRADFLEDHYDDWALLERERLRELYLRMLERLLMLYKQRGAYEQALACAQQLAAADSLREAAHRELMCLYHLLGRTHTALEQFVMLRELLAQELAITPTPTTVALYEEIAATLEGVIPPHLPVVPAPPPLLRDLAHLPFVGRTSERAVLVDALQAAIQGRGRLALIEGGAGVGKTRLISEIVADAQWRGFQVGLGKADPLAAPAPYQLLHDALSPLLTPLRITQLVELVEPVWLSVIIPLFPAIAEYLPDLPPPRVTQSS